VSAPQPKPNPSHPHALRETIASMFGGACCVLILFALRDHTVPVATLSMLVASMGASGVLVFGVPLGIFSRPSNLMADHLISALNPPSI